MTVGAAPGVVRARIAAEAAAAKKGDDIVVLEVAGILSIADYFVIVGVTSSRQARTVVDEVERALREHDGSRATGVEGREDGTWILLDFDDVIVHVLLTSAREYYDLERLWADAPRVAWDDDSVGVSGGSSSGGAGHSGSR